MSAVYYEILSAVQSQLAAIEGLPSVALRDDIFLLPTETAPIIIVAPGPRKDKIRLQTFHKNICYDYEVLVVYIIAGNRSVGEDLANYLLIRETIRNNLYQVGTLSGTWDTDMEINDVSKFPALVGGNYRVTGFCMKYSTVETRTGT